MILPSELLVDISKKYQVLEFVDLSAVVKDPGIAYSLFKPYHKQTFPPKERFVFYANGHVGQKTIEYLQYCADTFDISRCFILVCCSSHDKISQEYDLEFINATIKSANFIDDDMISLRTMCSLPWMHLEVMNSGIIKPCCFIQSTIHDKTTDLETLFQSEKMQKLRKNLYTGIKVPECGICWKAESQGAGSLRQWRLKSHSTELFTKRINSPNLVSLVLRPSTICNFKCRSCDSTSSSLWAQEDLAYAVDEKKKINLLQLIDDSKWFDKDPVFSKNVLNLIPKLEYLDIYGGEPLMNKQFKKLLLESIEQGTAKNQKLHFNTNGSIFPEDLLPLLNQFKEVTISLSIDDVGKRFEIIRGGDWNSIENNVTRFQDLSSEKFKISLLITVSNLNALYLDELVSWAESKSFSFTFNMLHHPDYLRFDQVSESLRNEMIRKFSGHSCNFLNKLSENLKTTVSIDPVRWRHQMQDLDYKRNQDLRQTHKELCELMHY